MDKFRENLEDFGQKILERETPLYCFLYQYFNEIDGHNPRDPVYRKIENILNNIIIRAGYREGALCSKCIKCSEEKNQIEKIHIVD